MSMADNTHLSAVDQAPGHPAEKLVSVETQSEVDLFSGQRAERIFLKLYVAARTSGLLAAISDRDWKTLCTLATYMDAEGYCFPSQAELARALGCSRQMANERVRQLAGFRFQDRAVILVEKLERSQTGRWGRNRYRVLPIARLSIFDGQTLSGAARTDRRKSNRPSWLEPQSGTREKSGETAMSRHLDTAAPRRAVSSRAVPASLDTNKTQVKKEISLSKRRKGKGTDRSGSPAAASQPATNDQVSFARRAQMRTPEPIGDTLDRRRYERPARLDSDQRDVILRYMQEFSQEFGDRAPLRSTTSRALNLYRRSGVRLETYVGCLYRARSITRERSATVQYSRAGKPAQNRTAYFFAVLEDLLHPKPGRHRNERSREA